MCASCVAKKPGLLLRRSCFLLFRLLERFCRGPWYVAREPHEISPNFGEGEVPGHATSREAQKYRLIGEHSEAVRKIFLLESRGPGRHRGRRLLTIVFKCDEIPRFG